MHDHRLPNFAPLDSALDAAHVPGRTLTCPTCGRSFDRPSSYQVHLRTHTGERPFACRLCGKDFGVRSNLNRHLKTTHAGEGFVEGDDGDAGAEEMV